MAADRPDITPDSPPPPPSPVPAGTPAVTEPPHLESEDTVVEELAEAGAEEGAGAQIRVAEPWAGYAQLKAADVVDQLAGRDQAALAAVELYELSHRRRQTVIDAAQRELRRLQNTP
jgi:hypothetical protein